MCLYICVYIYISNVSLLTVSCKIVIFFVCINVASLKLSSEIRGYIMFTPSFPCPLPHVSSYLSFGFCCLVINCPSDIRCVLAIQSYIWECISLGSFQNVPTSEFPSRQMSLVHLLKNCSFFISRTALSFPMEEISSLPLSVTEAQ